MNLKNKIFVISGPTASGKSFLAIELAKKYNCIIINADSMQIYNGLPILSAQPNTDELKEHEHKLYGMLKINESNSVAKWLELVKKESSNILNKNIVIIGGTGMYISRLIYGIIDLPEITNELRSELNNLYDTIGWDEFYKIVVKIDLESAKKIAKNDKQRLVRIYEIYKASGEKLSDLAKQKNKKLFDDENIFHINITPDRGVLYNRCELRFKKMLENNAIIDEVKYFIQKNEKFILENDTAPIYNTIGFREIKNYLDGEINKEEMFFLSVKNTKNYAKRQYTWFRNQFKKVDFLINVIPNIENYEIILNNINNKLLGKL